MTAAARVLWSLPTLEQVDPGWLDAGETRRLEQIGRSSARREFLTSRVLVKTLVGELLGVPAPQVRLGYTCALCGGPHGRPMVTSPMSASRVHVSLAHSGDRVVAAASTVAPLGVDVEPVAASDFDGFDAVALTPAERRQLRRLDGPSRRAARAAFWVRKEALLKASGDGLSLDPDTVDLARARAGLHDVWLGEDYAAALAVLTDQPVEVTVRSVSADLLAGPAGRSGPAGRAGSARATSGAGAG